MKKTIKEKLCSRKLWVAVITFLAMLAIALGFSEETVTQVAAVVMAGLTMISYIIGEGWVDADSKDEKG